VAEAEPNSPCSLLVPSASTGAEAREQQRGDGDQAAAAGNRIDKAGHERRSEQQQCERERQVFHGEAWAKSWMRERGASYCTARRLWTIAPVTQVLFRKRGNQPGPEGADVMNGLFALRLPVLFERKPHWPGANSVNSPSRSGGTCRNAGAVPHGAGGRVVRPSQLTTFERICEQQFRHQSAGHAAACTHCSIRRKARSYDAEAFSLILGQLDTDSAKQLFLMT
jgi:hypothetical protein